MKNFDISAMAMILILLNLIVIYAFYSYYQKTKKMIDKLEEDMECVIENISLDYKKGMQKNVYSRLYSKLFYIQESKKVYIKKQNDEMKTIHQMIADISHQVKTPITTAKMYGQMVAGKESIDEKKRVEYMEILNSQINKLDFLMQTLIKMSRLETNIITLHPKNYNVGTLLAEAFGGILWKAEKKNIHVSTDYGNGQFVYVDYKWTIEAIFNILDNAVKYTELNGEIKVRITDSDNFKVIQIEDNGCGIEESQIPLIFNRFYREDKSNEVEGLGLGLNLSKEIIKKEGGYIRVISEVNQGTTFLLYLPTERNEKTPVS